MLACRLSSTVLGRRETSHFTPTPASGRSTMPNRRSAALTTFSSSFAQTLPRENLETVSRLPFQALNTAQILGENEAALGDSCLPTNLSLRSQDTISFI